MVTPQISTIGILVEDLIDVGIPATHQEVDPVDVGVWVHIIVQGFQDYKLTISDVLHRKQVRSVY